MRTNLNTTTGWITWYSGKIPAKSLSCTYMHVSQMFTVRVFGSFRDIPVETEQQAKEMANTIIKAFEQAYEIAKIIQPN